jgi:hypothetical protein
VLAATAAVAVLATNSGWPDLVLLMVTVLFAARAIAGWLVVRQSRRREHGPDSSEQGENRH